MKDLIEALDKTFDSRIRLGIMSALMVNDAVDFNALKELLDTLATRLSSQKPEFVSYISTKSLAGESR
jgi:hypothetical protein